MVLDTGYELDLHGPSLIYSFTAQQRTGIRHNCLHCALQLQLVAWPWLLWLGLAYCVAISQCLLLVLEQLALKLAARIKLWIVVRVRVCVKGFIQCV